MIARKAAAVAKLAAMEAEEVAAAEKEEEAAEEEAEEEAEEGAEEEAEAAEEGEEEEAGEEESEEEESEGDVYEVESIRAKRVVYDGDGHAVRCTEPRIMYGSSPLAARQLVLITCSSSGALVFT